MMTLDELQELIDMAKNDGLPGTTRVMLMYQPTYPLREDIAGIVTEAALFEDAGHEDGDPEPKDILYILAGGAPANQNESPYGNRRAWDVASRY